MKTFTIRFSDHDNGATDGSMVREGYERAASTARLMQECGYRTVTITENA